MSEHDAEAHDEALERVLEATEPRRAFEGSPLAGCAACREELEDLLGLTGELDGLGRSERDGLREGLALPGVLPGRAEAALRAHAARGAGERRRTMRRVIGLAAALVAASALVLVLRAREGPLPDGGFLGDDAETAQPEGAVEDFSSFSWTDALPAEGWFRVVVYREDAAELASIAESPRLAEPRWSPPPSLHASWPDSIVWKLEIHRGSGPGDLAGSSLHRAWRSSR